MSEHDDERAVSQALDRLRDKLREAGLQPSDMETANEELIDEIKGLIEGAKEEARKRTEIAIFEAKTREKLLRSIRRFVIATFVLVLLLLLAQARHY